jgi:energy-coupling factor transport system permease protein
VLTFDARSWLIWVTATAAIVIVVRNPLYSLTLLLVVLAVGEYCTASGISVKRSTLRFGAAILLFTTLFHALSVHFGEHILFTLPASWPWVGGPVTLEAAAYGLGVGLTLLTLLTLFMSFNAIVPTSELVRLVPRAFRDLGVVLLISMTYVPETQKQLRRIQEAQAIRGHRMRGLKDWRPVLIPLTIGALERAMGLAEAMVSRGYGAAAGQRQPLLVQLGLVLGLLAALTGWVVTFWIDWIGWLLLILGILLMITLTMRLGRHIQRTYYHPRLWRARDSLLSAAVLLPLSLVFVKVPFADRSTLTYVPYPSLGIPPFDPLIGLALVSLALPAIIAVTTE